MKYRKLNEHGFHIVELVIIVVLIGILGLVGYRVYSVRDKKQASQSKNTSSNKQGEEVKWAFNGDKLEWFTEMDAAPNCKEPFIFDQSPVDLSKIQVIGMPGAYRGYSYKPHGGMRLNNPNSSGKIDIKMPTDATLAGLTRYYEGNPSELQYLLTFETDCGIAFRFDHLYTLSPEFQKIAETTPEPKKDDTRSDPNIAFTRTKFKTGDVVATEVGFPQIKNFGFDFGVYDYRSRNDISKNDKWAAIHNQYQATEWFGRCWIDMLPETDVTKAKELALVVINPAKPNIISDYCSYAPYKTLDFNNGQPTDG